MLTRADLDGGDRRTRSREKAVDLPRLIRTASFATQLYWKLKQKTPDTGIWLRERLTELGPLFVKLGQFASSRKDLIDEDI